MAAVVAGLVGVGGVWLLWKHTLGAGPFKGAIVLEVQRPWSRKLVQGEKKIEIRSYALPAQLRGKPMEVLETMRSSFGSTLPDVVDPDSDECDKLFLTGKIVVASCKEYTSEAQFVADGALHLACDSEFRFKPGTPCFGWVIKSAEAYDLPTPCPILRRVQRSLFKVLPAMPSAADL